MSAIDTTSNVHCGNFNDIPLYWCPEGGDLHQLVEDAPEDAVIKKSHLFIGGGSGEHPALLLNINKCIRSAISFLIDCQEATYKSSNASLESIHEKIDRLIFDDETADETLDGAYAFDINIGQWYYEDLKLADEYMASKVKDENFNVLQLEERIMVAIGVFALGEFQDYCMFCENEQLAQLFTEAYEHCVGDLFCEIDAITQGVKRFGASGIYKGQYPFTLSDYTHQVWNKLTNVELKVD